MRWRFAQETRGSDVSSISPSGFRTATAQVETPRIITPSSTACPPIGASREATGMPSGIRVRSTAVPSEAWVFTAPVSRACCGRPCA